MQIKSDQPNGTLLAGYFALKILPSLVGAMAIYLGYDLFIKGVTGQASLVVDANDLKGQLTNAAPGLFFALGGIATEIVVVWKGVQVSLDSSPRTSHFRVSRKAN